MQRLKYAIKKDVRNNPVVREVDGRRQRELWRWAFIGALLVLLALFSASQHFELLRHGYRLEPLQRERAEEEEIRRHLRLEIETLRAPQRIERWATERLGLVVPEPGDTIVIDRAVAPERPASSIVASR